MPFDLSQHLPTDFHPESRVWIYQSDRIFTPNESQEIESILIDFASNWTSHGAKVKGYGTLLFDCFIILIADETATGVSGCSTDSSVRMVKELEKKYNVDLFNRQLLSFFVNDKIVQLPLIDLKKSITENHISPETLYFNNTILSKKELEENWIIELKNSWLGIKLNS